MNRAFDLDEVYIKFVNWLQWEQAQPKFTKHIDWNRHKKSCLDDLGTERTDLTSDNDESLFGRELSETEEKEKKTKKVKKSTEEPIEEKDEDEETKEEGEAEDEDEEQEEE